ncbi:MAG: hypothetical protein LBQ18_07705 [Campylobacteraceae bacterium]|nr:hypothetical protein [Campylobacteraceae bacterium]
MKNEAAEQQRTAIIYPPPPPNHHNNKYSGEKIHNNDKGDFKSACKNRNNKKTKR